MKVIRAQVMGMCFGVKDALSTVMVMDNPEQSDRLRSTGS